jgi:multimeric flavodoxin WrbA
MKILGIVASPKGEKSQTLKLVQGVLEGAEAAGADTECIDLCKLKIKYCIACGACYVSGTCIHHDDFAGLYAKMLEADGLVWGSPDYFRSVTAQMKTLIDRMADTIHCQLFLEKYGCAVSVAGGLNHAETTGYLNQLLIGFGASTVGAVGAAAAVPASLVAAETEARALGQTLVEAIRSQRVYPEQEAVHREMRARFKHLVAANKDAWKHEYEHWLNQGWL